MDAFFGSPTNADSFTALVNETLYQRAEQLTRCMRLEGFDFFSESAEVREVGDQTWTSSVSLRGYGTVSSIKATIELRTTGAPQTAQQRANQAAYESLSSPEQDAFGVAYRACNDESRASHPEPGPGSDLSDELTAELARVQEEIDGHARLSAVWDDWSACMRESAYEFADRNDAAQWILTESLPVSGPLGAIEAGRDVPHELLVEFDALAALEAEVVERDLACAESTNLDDRLRNERFQLEAEALSTHGSRWAVLRAGSD